MDKDMEGRGRCSVRGSTPKIDGKAEKSRKSRVMIAVFRIKI